MRTGSYTHVHADGIAAGLAGISLSGVRGEDGLCGTGARRLGRLETMQHQLASFKEQNRSGYGFELDARAFCRNCTPEPAGEPDAVLRATAPDGREQVTRGLSMEDIQLLRRFAGNPEMADALLRALLGLAPEEE